jgi:hypothetical protein
MISTTRFAFVVAALVYLSGCGGGGGGGSGGASSGGGGDKVTSDCLVMAAAVPDEGMGFVTVRFTLVDPDSDPIDLAVEISMNGKHWYPATVAKDASLTGLPSSPGGVEGTILWDSLDLGFRGAGGFLRFIPSDGAGRGTSATKAVPGYENLREAGRRVDFYMIHYGPFDDESTRVAETHDLVILHPFTGQVSVKTVKRIQDGIDKRDPRDDVLVLAYISIGEDVRTIGVTDAEMLLDSRFVGDGSGPRMDPRGPDMDGQPLVNIDPLGAASNGGTGYASWFLDDNSIDRSPSDVGDGLPDRNSVFGGCFVNAGDPKWYAVLDDMRFESKDGMPGTRELLTDDYGRGYACDGLFLDTVDTCAPNWFTDGTSPNQSEYEWTAPGFRWFIKKLNEDYPDRLVLQNRGLFFFDPTHPQYAVTTRAYVDYVKYESYRLNSNTHEEYNDYFFPDNKFNVAPRLMAEANRKDGFTVLSLGYAEGPSGDMSVDTLLYESTDGFDSLLIDIFETQDLVGFRHYITDGMVALPNTFVVDHTDLTDTTPPAWSSTYNPHIFPFPTPPLEPDARVGVQELTVGIDSVTLRFDVALDFHRVGYALYHDTQPFDLAGDPDLENVTRLVLDPVIGARYAGGTGASVYPHEVTITGLTTGTTYWFCIRAFDSVGNEEKNEVVLAATPLGQHTVVIDGDFSDWGLVTPLVRDPADLGNSAGPDWREISIANDSENLYIRYTSENPFNLDGSPDYTYSRTLIFIDTDDDATTGFGTSDIGSELLVAGDSLYRQTKTSFNAGFLSTLAVAPVVQVTDCELSIPLARIRAADPNAKTIRVFFANDDGMDFAPDSGHMAYELKD